MAHPADFSVPPPLTLPLVDETFDIRHSEMNATEQQPIQGGPQQSGSGQPATGSDGGTGWRPGLDPSDEARLTQAQKEQFATVEEIPTDNASLGWYSVSCLILNRLIGSGIFNSSSVIFSNTQSIGISLLFWLYGLTMAISGTIVYIELGLTVPRYRLGDGTSKISVVRSGGELPYLNYFIKRPRFLATCLFGVSFLIFGNTSFNSIASAVAVLQASNTEETRGMVAGIAMAVNTFACLLHSMSRKWGIRLNNFFGTAKLAMLFCMIVFGFAQLGKDGSVAATNFDRTTAFSTANSPEEVYRYAEAIILAIFPFSGFHQANYVSQVLAEIQHPRRNFAQVSFFCVALTASFVVTINILYAAVIPKDILFMSNHDQAFEFFSHTIGRVSSRAQTQAICGSFRALSAIGNVIVFTFTAARVKQEIAKEGILPYPLLFASSYSFSIRSGFRRLPPSRSGYQLYSSRAPAAALALHWVVTSIVILATVFGTVELSSSESRFDLSAYYLGIAAFAYGLDIIWFSVMGTGVLCLRLWPGTAATFAATNAFPLIAIWIPDPAAKFLSNTSDSVAWYAPQTYGIAVLVFGVMYWLCFRFYIYHRKMKAGESLEIVRIPIFWRSPIGELLQLYEIVKVRWTRYIQGEKRESTTVRLTEFGTPGYETRTTSAASRERGSKRVSGARKDT
ncbi:amino acid permease-domain-containing protein [Lasiosphaeria miniovina]|uniref:Amino acid permease-domain-containing protein n=1 Tax=Lasiosphaeria miniovina TaxID=1954250 RepID=A0AA40DL72_9PEZI|nr:amino acid permease-domain-containing protein [Lasiosphaeria miniovina]KAK0703923.1 amino acid permease-domain-containing protein [Lasiosphaeria miniovina]